MKFSKDAISQTDELVKAATEARTGLDSAVEEFNLKLEEIRSELQGKIDAYNEAVVTLREHIESERDQFESEFEDHSEAWQEGEKGDAARSFIDNIEEAISSLEEIELEVPEDIEMPEDEAPAAIIEAMPKESE